MPKDKFIKNGLSVIICCYNSSERITATLKRLTNQINIEEVPCEIIIVNNASTDNTCEVANAAWEMYQLTTVNFKIVEEKQPGLSHAREKGIQTAAYEYIVFCDDDNWLATDYLAVAYKTITASPQIGALGGQSDVASNIIVPDWFEASKNHYAVGKQAEFSRDVTDRKYLWGSGIVIRRSLYVQAFKGFPSLLTGRRGKSLSSGEDSEMCMRFILMGYRLVYNEDLNFIHFIEGKRLTHDYDKKLVEGFLEAYKILLVYVKFIDFRHLKFKHKLILLIKSVLKIIIYNIAKDRYPHISDEKLNVFILTNIKFKSVNHAYKKISKLLSR